MSVNYYMACEDCKEHIWIAQDGMSGPAFYSGEKETMKAYKEFLFRHQRHLLRFVPEEMYGYFDDYGENDDGHLSTWTRVDV